MLARALLTHPLIAAVMTGLLLLARVDAVSAAILVTVWFYAREAGQIEHDLKGQGWPPLRAWAGAYFGFGWRASNAGEAVAPALVGWAAAIVSAGAGWLR